MALCIIMHGPLGLEEVEMIKERFAKLLLGEDLSGGGKGVSTALAISNAITNVSGNFNTHYWFSWILLKDKLYNMLYLALKLSKSSFNFW